MNIVIFASDSKGVSSVINIVKELKNTNHNYFFLYSQDTQLQFPIQNLDRFSYDSNILLENWEGVWCHNLNVNLPFIPDVLIIQRERWHPEQSIISEFRVKWNCKISLIETNSHLCNNVETVLEMFSRTKYPQNQVDIFFEHSSFTKQERGKSGFNISKSLIVGNPKYDNLKSIDYEYCYKKYNIDKNKKCILFYSIINTAREKTFECLESLVKKLDHSKYKIFFKPYPGEPFHEKFVKQFNPFIYDDVTVIYDDIDISAMTHICDIHIGAIGSIFHYPLLLNKKIVSIDNIIKDLQYNSNLERYENESNIGVEDSMQFWMRVHELKTKEEFYNLIDLNRIESFKQDIEYLMDIIKKCTIPFDYNLEFLKVDQPDTKELLSLFDNYNDYSASTRIIKELEKFF